MKKFLFLILITSSIIFGEGGTCIGDTSGIGDYYVTDCGMCKGTCIS